jgi:archaellum component FlaC
MNMNVIQGVLPLPIKENGKQKIFNFLHSVPSTKMAVKQNTNKPMEEQIENITNGISQMTMDIPKASKRVRASPKIRMIDEEIEQLTKRIKALEMKKSSLNKKSIEDLISENIDIQTPKRKKSSSQSTDDLFTRIESLTISQPSTGPGSAHSSSAPSSAHSTAHSTGRSRVSSTKTTLSEEDVLSVLKQVDKNKISGKRGKNFYSAEELMNFLTQLQLTTSGNKEAIAQRLLDVIEQYKYGL